MNQKVAAIRAGQWRQIIQDCINRDSDISKRQWCRENGVRYRSFMYWQHKFQLEAIDLMENHGTALPVKQLPVSAQAFVDMTPQLEALQTGRESSPASSELTPLASELMIQAGPFRIYVNGSIQEGTLETVMRVIRHA